MIQVGGMWRSVESGGADGEELGWGATQHPCGRLKEANPPGFCSCNHRNAAAAVTLKLNLKQLFRGPL